MFKTNEIKRYSEGLKDLMKEFDKYIGGLWRYDYDKGGIRTSFQCKLEGDKEVFIIYFGSSHTQLVIDFKEVKNDLEITDIRFINYTDARRGCVLFKINNNLAYSSEVLSLIGYVVKGKSYKELATEKLEVLENKANKEKASIEGWRTTIDDRAEALEGLLKEIQKLKNAIESM